MRRARPAVRARWDSDRDAPSRARASRSPRARPIARIERGWPGRILLEDLLLELVLVVGAERALAGRQLVQQDADAKHVAAAIERLATQLLRRHVAGFAFERA